MRRPLSPRTFHPEPTEAPPTSSTNAIGVQTASRVPFIDTGVSSAPTVNLALLFFVNAPSPARNGTFASSDSRVFISGTVVTVVSSFAEVAIPSAASGASERTASAKVPMIRAIVPAVMFLMDFLLTRSPSR